MARKSKKSKDIGLNVKPPKNSCTDKKCPFHGQLSVRGQVITGVVTSVKMDNSILVKQEYRHYIPKYDRYERRSSEYAAHCPPCIELKEGDEVKIAECRPLSKTIFFVTVEKI